MKQKFSANQKKILRKLRQLSDMRRQGHPCIGLLADLAWLIRWASPRRKSICFYGINFKQFDWIIIRGVRCPETDRILIAIEE